MKGNDVVVIGKESTDVEPPTVSTYRNKSEDLYAEDVDQYMAILSEVVTPTAEISLGDI